MQAILKSAFGIFTLISLIFGCAAKESENSTVSAGDSCNESRWSQCIVELSMIDKEADFGKYLRKEMECKRICNR